MSEKEIKIAAHAILLKIHVITGWVVPADETFLDILLDQFKKKLAESYSNVNMDEIEYAFRVYGTEVKDWGKAMNLSLIDEVMIPYLDKRSEVSRIEEQKKQKMIEAPKESLSDEAMRQWFEEVKKNVVNGMDYSLIPVMIYDWLDRNGEMAMDNKTKYGYMDAAARKIESQGEPPLVDKVKAMAKKMAVNDYILKNG